MQPHELSPAVEPTFYFIGVTTGKSSIMRVFPKWAQLLGLGEVPIRGVDCKPHDDPEVYRHVVKFLKNDPLSLGALVTTHKIDLLKACRDLFDDLDVYATTLGEVSSVSKNKGRFWGHAKDPITAGLALEAFLPRGYWPESGAEVHLIGAGGSSLALTMYWMEKSDPQDRPKRILVSNRSTQRLEEMKSIHDRINPGISMDYVHTPNSGDNDEVVNNLIAGSLVINATGLGKDAPGSPLTENAHFPDNGYIWDFNYRDDLVFLDQAREQAKLKNLRIEDGWIYFIHGWTRVIAEVFHLNIPTSGPEFDRFSAIAGEVRE